MWESVADTVPDLPAVTNGDAAHVGRVRHADGADRSRAHGRRSRFAGQGRLYLYNGNEYLEAQYGTFKNRGVAINVNYRYLDEELWYLLDNADAEALVSSMLPGGSTGSGTWSSTGCRS